MRSALAIAMLFASGCRAILGLDEGVVAAGDATPADAPIDLQTDAPGPWTIELMDGITDDQDPTLTADMLELYFSRTGDIYFMTRTSTTAAWSTPTVSPLSSTSTDLSPALTADGLAILFGSNRGSMAGDIYFSTRMTRTSAWAPPALVMNLNSAANDTPGSLTQDNLRMVMSSARAGDPDLYEATRANMTADFAAPVILPLSTMGSDQDAPHLTLDGLTLYYSAGAPTARDLFVATRPSLTGAWSSPVLLTELSSSANDSDPWASPDGNQIYFSSSRGGTMRMYHASR